MLFFTQIQENSSNKTLGDQAILFKFKWFFLEIWQFLIGANWSLFHQEVRLNINKDHPSWEDDSTGPKGENTEEAEVSLCPLCAGAVRLKHCISDNQGVVET